MNQNQGSFIPQRLINPVQQQQMQQQKITQNKIMFVLTFLI